MTVLAPGMSLFLRCVGDAQHPGNRMLNGDTIRGAVTLEADTSVPWSGTRWFVVDGGAGLVALQCLGDLAGSRFLNGHTNDGAAGTVDLAPTTEGGFTGTRWQAAEDSAGGLTLQCMGSDRNENFQFLDGHTSEGIVRLAPSADGGFTGTHWTTVEIVDHTTTPASLNGPALTFSVDGPNVFGVAMAWTGFDGRINVQRLVGGGAEDVTMLVDTAIDRPALTVHNDRLHLAFTAPDGSIHVMASDDAHVFDTVNVLSVGTALGPGLASFEGSIVVAWVDANDGTIHVLDVDRPNRIDLAETSAFAPALLGVPSGTTRDASLFLAWTGTDSSHTLNTTWAPSVARLEDLSGKKVLPDTSIDGPALAWREDFNSGLEPELVLGWTGRPGGPDGDNHLNIAFSETGVGDWRGKTTVASTSGRAPALTYFNQTADPGQGVIFTAWTEKLPSLRIDTHNFLGLPVIPT